MIDPHKHGLQPYGCGCVLFADPDVGRLYAHDSPYTYFTSPDLHLGEISLECSRAGASAAALWTTLRALPLTRDGLGAGLADCRAAALGLADRLRGRGAPGTGGRARAGHRLRARPGRGRRARLRHPGADGWHVATLRTDHGTALRCCLLKPEHLGVVDGLAERPRGRTGAQSS